MVRNTLSTILTSASFAIIAAARQCQNLTIPLSVSSRNGVFDIDAPKTNVDVTSFILDLSQPGSNLTEKLLSGYATVSGTYNIAATYCEPDSGPGKALQVLTHGIGFDRSYWDLPANSYNYSYVNQALDRGYSTFTYDRLGIGQSQHGEPVNEIQSFLELASLIELTTLLRGGEIEGVCVYDKVAHAGHSFGSIQTYGLAGQRPELTDAIVLQGFSQDAAYLPYFELGGNFVQANGNPALAAYPDGYLAAGDESGVQTNFFAPGDFDPAMLDLAYKTGEPVTVGELLTVAAPASAPNPYTGPVLVVTGGTQSPALSFSLSFWTKLRRERAQC
jgi:pimeloyl-ACP methyl ester carboxylesterase